MKVALRAGRQCGLRCSHSDKKLNERLIANGTTTPPDSQRQTATAYNVALAHRG